MKKLFFAGLIILLPFALTFMIIMFLINLFTYPFQELVESFLANYGLLGKPFLFLSGQQVLYVGSKVLVLIALFFFIVLFGFLARIVLINTLFRFGDLLIDRIPFINKLYKVAQDVVKTIFESKSSAFSNVVLVRFPHTQAYCVGLVPHNQMTSPPNKILSIFIPGSPTPTMGFMLRYKHEEIIFIDMKVEEALKYVVSCGVVNGENLFNLQTSTSS